MHYWYSIRPEQHRRATAWLAAAAAAGAALALLYRDGDQQDAGYHFLLAQWGWQEPSYFVNVWARPLFTLVYSFPSMFGYPAAKLFTVAVCIATARQTWRLAVHLRLDRAELAIPLLFIQPAFLLICSTTMTEPLFALVFVSALKWHEEGHLRTGALAASLLILVRPEGAFIGILWGLWVLLDRRSARKWMLRIPDVLILAAGAALWWGAAWLITGDPMWIPNNWPRDWGAASAANGRGPWWWYLYILPLIVGPVLLPLFLLGIKSLLLRRRFLTGVSAVLFLLALHAVMFANGWFGAAGYARYLVCVSPAIVLITLAGWEELHWLRRRTAATIVLALSALFAFFYVDGDRYSRDAVAIDEMAGWFETQQLPVERLVFSQVYMCIRLRCGIVDRLNLTSDREKNIEYIQSLPPQTLVFWDGDTGPKWFGLTAEDFPVLGYRPLRSREYELHGRFFKVHRQMHGGPRHQQMHLFYKQKKPTAEDSE